MADLVDTSGMSAAGSPIDTSLVQAAQAQQTASKARDRQRAESDRTQRYSDLVELRVAGVESSEALRQLPQNDSEQAGAEHQAKGPFPGEAEQDSNHVDVVV